MNRIMKVSMIAATIVGITGLGFNAPAEAHHNNNNAYANQLAMQMYLNNLAIQQQQAAYGIYPYNAYAQQAYGTYGQSYAPINYGAYAAPSTYVQPYAQHVAFTHAAYAPHAYMQHGGWNGMRRAF